MKYVSAFAALCVLSAPCATAQASAGSLRLVGSSAAPAETPAAAAVPAATGWTGPVSFSPVMLVDLIGRACRAAISGDGGDLEAHARAFGLGPSSPAPEELARALPQGAVTWRVPASDGGVYLYGYGEAPLSCGVAVIRPLAQAGFDKTAELLTGASNGLVQDSTQMLPGDVHWARFRSPKGEFVDVMEYPPNGDAPGVLRADYLPG